MKLLEASGNLRIGKNFIRLKTWKFKKKIVILTKDGLKTNAEPAGKEEQIFVPWRPTVADNKSNFWELKEI